MKHSALATRYAKALYGLVSNQAFTLQELRAVEKILLETQEAQEFFASQVISAKAKVAVVEKSFEGKGLSIEVFQTLVVLAKNDRMSIFTDIVLAFQSLADQQNGVVRGEVKSAAPLDADARKKLESVIAKATQKKLILSFHEDENLVGGVVAQVGGWTFEDTLESHIRRLNEELKRSAH